MIIRERLNGFVKKMLHEIKRWLKTSQRYVRNFIEVLKMVKLQSSKMFVKDPIDVWGQETSIGPAEQALRTQFPYVYNRSGNVIYWDDFESPTVKPHTQVTGAGTCNRTCDKSLFGDFSMKFVTGNVAANICSAKYHLNNFRSGKLGMLAHLMTPDVQVTYALTLYYYDGTTAHIGRILVDVSDGKVYYGYPAPTTHIDTISWYTSGTVDLFVPIKLVADISKGVFDNLYIARNKIDMSSYSLYTAASGIKQSMIAEIEIATKANASYTAYMDNVIITDNEP